jgi:hypothetical protein
MTIFKTKYRIYKIKKTTQNQYYLIRVFTPEGLKACYNGLISNKSGVIFTFN